MSRTALILLLLLAWVGAAHGESGVTPRTYDLDDILAADPRQSAAACSAVDYRTAPGSAPFASPNPEGVTIVEISLFVLAINEIDPRTNTFRFEGFGAVTWCDPRLGFDPLVYGADRKIFHQIQAWEYLSERWAPGLFFPDRLGHPDRTSEQVVVYPDGTVGVHAKFNSQLLADFDFRKFPLDRQTLRIAVQPYVLHAGSIRLIHSERLTGFNEGFQIPEWEFRSYKAGLEDDGDPDESHFVMEIRIARRAGFYVWKILLPLLIVVAIAWSTFWMTRDSLAQRQRQSATSILTLVAYQFVASGDLPRVSYLTVMDALILWSFLVIGSTLITNVTHMRRFRAAQQDGLSADRIGRRYFPLVYLGGFVVLSIFVTLVL